MEQNNRPPKTPQEEEEDKKRKKLKETQLIINSILTLYEKGGCTIATIWRDFLNMEGRTFAPSASEAADFMTQMPNVVCRDGKYFSQSKASAHIREFVRNQGRRPAFAPRNNYGYNNNTNNNSNNNASAMHRRKSIHYDEPYIDNPMPSTSRGPCRITNRRRTMAAPKRRSDSPPPYQPRDKKPRPSSPPPRYDDAHPSTSGYNRRSPGRRSPGRRSPVRRSPVRRSPARRSPAGRSPARHTSATRQSPDRQPNRPSPATQTSRSGSWSPDQENCNPPHNHHTPLVDPQASKTSDQRRNSPSGSRVEPSTNEYNTYHNNHEQSGPTTQSTPVKAVVNGTAPIANGVPEEPHEIILNPTTMLRNKTVFKYLVIGDAFIHGILTTLSGMDMALNDFNTLFCRRELTVAEVHDNVPKLQDRGTKAVIISIGETDIRQGIQLHELKRLYTGIFIACQNYGFVPIVTTVLCSGPTAKLKKKVDIFNQFILDNFTNVLDLWKVCCFGLEKALHNEILTGAPLEPTGNLQHLRRNELKFSFECA